MSLLERARRDQERILNDQNDFAVEVTLEDGQGNSATVAGIYNSHFISFDTEGNPVRSRQTTIDVHENTLQDKSYPTRNADNKVDLKNHKISFIDFTGDQVTFKVKNFLPDNTLGNIIIVLSSYA